MPQCTPIKRNNKTNYKHAKNIKSGKTYKPSLAYPLTAKQGEEVESIIYIMLRMKVNPKNHFLMSLA
jgi:hypothetical protein